MLISFIADVLDLNKHEIKDVVIENSEITPDEIDGKFTRFDMKLTAGKRLINVEIQVYNRGDFKERSLYYWAQRYSSQLKKGDKYSDISETVSINIVNFKMFDTNSYYSKYTMADLDNMIVLTNKCAIYYFELPKLDNTLDRTDKRKQWMQLINAEKESDLEMLQQTQSADIQKGVDVIRSYSEIKSMREMARRREEALMEERSALYNAEQRGIQQGIQQAYDSLFEKMRSLGYTEEQIAMLR